ncbi:DUF1627 domain-containing protein [Escherichia coli]|uniref:DUF1627 domain-containing protein n=1 Tax=Escherichia coli TaxID=562 RepID=UPI001F109868|nr:DUF1627 domain-containing protein [Escherichia coli]UMR98451.1 hypothetical protein AOY87_09225 [Escherichia coli]
METVFDALKAMGKASSQEVAARLGISREDAVNELWKLKRRGEADSQGSMWWLSNSVEETEQEYVPAVKITERDLTEIIEKHGTQTADELAAVFSISTTRVKKTLAYAVNRGRIVRVIRDDKYHYTIPDGNGAAAEAAKEEPVQDVGVQTDVPGVDTDATEQQLADEHPDNLVSTLLRRADRQLRLAKGSVVKHERVCAALRVLNDNRDIVDLLYRETGR